MRKTTKLFFQLMIGTQLTSCSMVQDYIISAAPTLFRSYKPLSTSPILQYDFIEPRRIELHQTTTSRLNEASEKHAHFTYYSATGYKCYTISLNPLQSVCDIDGRWVELAPVLSY